MLTVNFVLLWSFIFNHNQTISTRCHVYNAVESHICNSAPVANQRIYPVTTST